MLLHVSKFMTVASPGRAVLQSSSIQDKLHLFYIGNQSLHLNRVSNARSCGRRSSRPSTLLRPPPDDLFFVVAAHDYSEVSGGVLVLHRLCDRLNTVFTDVRDVPLCYLTRLDMTTNAIVLNPEYKTPVLPSWMDAKDGIVVYPEIVFGNPFNASRVINWMLYFPGLNSGPSADDYDDRNLIACYGQGVCSSFNRSRFHTVPLRVSDYQFTQFLNLPVAESREGNINFRAKDTFFSSRSGAIRRNDTFPRNGTVMERSTGKRERLEMFARAETFYSLDAATFRNVEAAMAGATSIVFPVEGVSKDEWLRTVGEEWAYGIAYGEDDIPHAKRTQHLVMSQLSCVALKQDEGIREFVAKSCSHFRIPHSKTQPRGIFPGHGPIDSYLRGRLGSRVPPAQRRLSL